MRWLNLLCIAIFLISSCQENIEDVQEDLPKRQSNNTSDLNIVEIPDSIKSNFDLFLKYFLEHTLGIATSEEYTTEINNFDMNGDETIDKIITVNRLNKAKKDLNSSANPAKFIDMGMMGNYNLILAYDGKSNSFIDWKTIPSSPFKGLKILPVPLSTKNTSQISLEYRIRDAAYVNLYEVSSDKLNLVFQYKKFDRLSQKTTESYSLTIEKTSRQGEFYDLSVHSGKIEPIPENADPYVFEPSIIKTSDRRIDFFYLNSMKKYYTQNITD